MPKILGLFAVAAMLTLGCLAIKARENATLPSLRLAWPAVRSDIELGVEDAQLPDPVPMIDAIADLQKGLDLGDITRITSAPWSAMEPYAQRGVDVRIRKGELDPEPAESFRASIRKFGEALAKMRIPQ